MVHRDCSTLISCAESLQGSGLGLCRFFFPASRWSGGFERVQQTRRNFRHLIDCRLKGDLVRLRWLVESADLSDELQRCRPNLVFRNWWIEVEKCLNIPTHLGPLELNRC